MALISTKTKQIITTNWAQIRNSLLQVNPELTHIVDAISPDNTLPLLQIKYQYGNEIVNRGQCQIPVPEGNGMLAINSPHLTTGLRAQLNYAKLPLALSLNRACEVFIYDDYLGHTSPLNLLQPGELFGVFETLDGLTKASDIQPVWHVSSGARTIFMLEKISDTRKHSRLQRAHHLKTAAPQALQEHHATFAELSRSATWDNDILFFTSEWFKHLNDPAWHQFKSYLFQCGWRQTEYIRTRTLLANYWKRLARLKVATKYKHSAYILDTVRYLTCACLGVVPSLRPSCGSELAAPVGLIEQAYCDSYGLQDYLPIIMQPYMHKMGSKLPFYYSMNLPMLLEGAPIEKNRPNLISDLTAIRDVLSILTQTDKIIRESEKTPLTSFSFDYYHSTQDLPDGIKPAASLPESDPTLCETQHSMGDRTYPNQSAFHCGCIRIQEQTQR